MTTTLVLTEATRNQLDAVWILVSRRSDADYVRISLDINDYSILLTTTTTTAMTTHSTEQHLIWAIVIAWYRSRATPSMSNRQRMTSQSNNTVDVPWTTHDANTRQHLRCARNNTWRYRRHWINTIGPLMLFHSLTLTFSWFNNNYTCLCCRYILQKCISTISHYDA